MAPAPDLLPLAAARPPDGAPPGPDAPHGPDAPSVPSVRERLNAFADASPLTVLRRLESSAKGLDEREAERRLPRDGARPLVPGAVRRAAAHLARLARTATDPFVLVLAGLSLVSAVTGDPRGAVLIALVAALSCLLRFRQEHRSDLAAARLRALTTTTATVLRRAEPGAAPAAREVPVDQVVAGDVVLLGPGDMVPADLRLLKSSDLRVDQSAFTGESPPAGKRAAWTGTGGAPAGERPGLFERRELCLMGTSVVSGTGTAVAVATGSRTYFGATHRDLPRRAPATTFDRGVRAVSWALLGAVLAAVPVVFALNGIDRGSWSHALLFAVSVAVAITPEMLPLVVTTALARGAAVLARGHVLARRLPAVHNLGAMDTLCTDKTGTLTLDRITLACHVDPLGAPDAAVLHWARVNALWSAELTPEAVGDTIDEALLAADGSADRTAGGAAGDPYEDVRGVGAIAFDSARRRATVIVRPRDRLGCEVVVTKGAVEDVLELCERVRLPGGTAPLDAGERDRLLALADGRAADGIRLLAVATAERPPSGRGPGPADERGLTLLGFVGFHDEPDPSAAGALAGLARLGVRHVIVTGDHPLAARRTCRDAGRVPGRTVLGAELAALDDGALRDLVATADSATTLIFARVDPRAKARIVAALQRAGRTVGFLGDGVNDAPALRAADVGISVTGAVDLARESADVILLRKDLRALERAITEGRRTFGAGVTYIKIAVTSNVGNVASMLAASALLPFMPLLPLQVLAQNLVFDLSQLSLAYDRVDRAGLAGPRTFDVRDLARFVAFFGLIGAVFDLATFGLLWWALQGYGDGPREALFHSGWFAENLLTQAVAILLLRGRGRRRGSPRPARPVVLAAVALSLTGLLLPFSPLGAAIGLRPLPAGLLPVLAAVLAGYALATILMRRLYLRLFQRWL